MTRDDILRMARKAGFTKYGVFLLDLASPEDIERFAALVRAAALEEAADKARDQLRALVAAANEHPEPSAARDRFHAAARALADYINSIVDPKEPSNV